MRPLGHASRRQECLGRVRFLPNQSRHEDSESGASCRRCHDEARSVDALWMLVRSMLIIPKYRCSACLEGRGMWSYQRLS